MDDIYYWLCLSLIQFFIQCDVDVDYPSEVEEKVIGKSMLFKVSKIPGLTLKGYPCYEVLRVCSDHEIISVFISQARSISSVMVICVELCYIF